MEQLLQSLNVMLLGMCGIFIVMSVLSLAIALLNRMFKKYDENAAAAGSRFCVCPAGQNFSEHFGTSLHFGWKQW